MLHTNESNQYALLEEVVRSVLCYFAGLTQTASAQFLDNDYELYGNLNQAALGVLCSRTGDINGDGLSDWLAAEPDYKNGSYNKEGRVIIGLSYSRMLRRYCSTYSSGSPKACSILAHLFPLPAT